MEDGRSRPRSLSMVPTPPKRCSRLVREMYHNGSVQHIEAVPQEIRNKYKTVWEIPMRNLIDMAADRGVYICQSQSLNLWLEEPDSRNTGSACPLTTIDYDVLPDSNLSVF